MQTVQHSTDFGLDFASADPAVAAPAALSEGQQMREWRGWVSDAMARGLRTREIETHLVSCGWTAAEATALIAIVQQPATDAQLDSAHRMATEWQSGQVGAAPAAQTTRDGSRDTFIGACWLVGGLAVTLISYSAAASSPNGGKYYFAYGAIAYGAIRLIRGLSA
jgi:hypothetical protein